MSRPSSLSKLKTSLSKWNRKRKMGSRDGPVSKWFRKRRMDRVLRLVIVKTQKAFDAQTQLGFDDVKALLKELTPYEVNVPLVRIGPDFDGGYLVPDDLEGIAALFSPGVSDTLGFDVEFAKQGINCFLADASIDTPQNLLPNMQFRQKFIGPQDKDQFMTMDTWLAQSVSPDDDLILQMDIEGAEYSVLQNMSEDTLERFRIMLIEFHNLHHVFMPETHGLYRDVFAKLRRTHTICHVHANNAQGFVCISGLTMPPIIELSFIRNDRFTSTGVSAKIPHPLDQPNVAYVPDIPTPHFWAA